MSRIVESVNPGILPPLFVNQRNIDFFAHLFYDEKNGSACPFRREIMFEKHTVYKHDNYNMLTVEVQGKTLVVREISDQWGEDTRQFVSRPEMMDWAEKRFRPEDFPGGEEEFRRVMDTLRSI
jgi:hypothetical protein